MEAQKGKNLSDKDYQIQLRRVLFSLGYTRGEDGYSFLKNLSKTELESLVHKVFSENMLFKGQLIRDEKKENIDAFLKKIQSNELSFETTSEAYKKENEDKKEQLLESNVKKIAQKRLEIRKNLLPSPNPSTNPSPVPSTNSSPRASASPGSSTNSSPGSSPGPSTNSSPRASASSIPSSSIPSRTTSTTSGKEARKKQTQKSKPDLNMLGQSPKPPQKFLKKRTGGGGGANDKGKPNIAQKKEVPSNVLKQREENLNATIKGYNKNKVKNQPTPKKTSYRNY